MQQTEQTEGRGSILSRRTFPKNARGWFELLPLGIKTCVSFAPLALLTYEKAASQPGSLPHSVHTQMKDVGMPVQNFCIVAAVVLIGTGILKLFQNRGRQAIWDFAFVLLALFCWSWAAGSMVKVR
jgi:hypothetical protein